MKSLSIILVLYIFGFSFLSIRNHELYQTFGWDLGFFDQLLWQASRGNLNFVSTIGDINLVGDHFQPILYLLAPLYWLWDDVRVILVAQAIIVSSAAIPIYLLAKKKFTSAGHPGVLRQTRDDRISEFLALSIAGSFLLFHGTQFTLTNEFHQSAFIPLFLSWGLYFLETDTRTFRRSVTLESRVRRGAIGSQLLDSIASTRQTGLRSRMTLGVVSLFMLLLIREESALLIAGIGLMYLVRWRVKLGTGLVIVGIASFFLLISFIIPFLSSQGKYIHFGYGELGSTPTEVITNSLNDPLRTLQLLVSPEEKLIQVRNSLLAFGGLPLLSPTSLIPVVIHYAVRFIDTRNVHRWLDTNHYAAPLGPLLAFATIQALSVIPRLSVMSSRSNDLTRNLTKSFRTRSGIYPGSRPGQVIDPSSSAGMTAVVSFILLFGIVGTNLLVHAPIFALTKSQLYFTPQWVKDANQLVASVPKDAAVAANNSLVPHLSHREKIYLLPDIQDAEYIAVDLSDGPNKYAPWGYERMREYVDELIVNGGWIIKKQFGNGLLLVKSEG